MPLLFFHEKMIDHDPGERHPERPDRLRSIHRRLRDNGRDAISWQTPEPVDREWLDRVHDADYVDRLLELRGTSRQLDPDTIVSPATIDAAELAAGALCDAVCAVCDDDGGPAFALVRPPGHHAESHRSMGFCFFDNIAVGARFALDNFSGVDRVLIVDWDVHHGNGTQEIFFDDDEVLFYSVHQFPFYPGSGAHDETGEDDGTGFTVNTPLPPGMHDADYVTAFDQVLEPIAEAYDPDMIFVSAGFDAHRLDPLAGMEVTSGGFAALCERVVSLADRLAGGRLVLTLEGGYHLDGLANSVDACVDVLAGDAAPEIDGPLSRGADDALDRVVSTQRGFWSL